MKRILSVCLVVMLCLSIIPVAAAPVFNLSDEFTYSATYSDTNDSNPVWWALNDPNDWNRYKGLYSSFQNNKPSGQSCDGYNRNGAYGVSILFSGVQDTRAYAGMNFGDAYYLEGLTAPDFTDLVYVKYSVRFHRNGWPDDGSKVTDLSSYVTDEAGNRIGRLYLNEDASSCKLSLVALNADGTENVEYVITEEDWKMQETKLWEVEMYLDPYNNTYAMALDGEFIRPNGNIQIPISTGVLGADSQSTAKSPIVGVEEEITKGSNWCLVCMNDFRIANYNPDAAKIEFAVQSDNAGAAGIFMPGDKAEAYVSATGTVLESVDVSYKYAKEGSTEFLALPEDRVIPADAAKLQVSYAAVDILGNHYTDKKEFDVVTGNEAYTELTGIYSKTFKNSADPNTEIAKVQNLSEGWYRCGNDSAVNIDNFYNSMRAWVWNGPGSYTQIGVDLEQAGAKVENDQVHVGFDGEFILHPSNQDWAASYQYSYDILDTEGNKIVSLVAERGGGDDEVEFFIPALDAARTTCKKYTVDCHPFTREGNASSLMFAQFRLDAYIDVTANTYRVMIDGVPVVTENGVNIPIGSCNLGADKPRNIDGIQKIQMNMQQEMWGSGLAIDNIEVDGCKGKQCNDYQMANVRINSTLLNQNPTLHTGENVITVDTNAKGENIIFVGVYDSNDRLASVVQAVGETGQKHNTITVTVPENVTGPKAKIFFFDNITRISPLTSEVSIGE
ncbi:MAG: hypothetical protein ACI4DY_11855 [Monoglobaceae bacterium]